MPDLMPRTGDLIREGAVELRTGGIEGAAREARWIAEAVFGMTGADLLAGADAPLDEALPGRYREAVARRADGEPLAYVTGRAAFRHLTLGTDRRALIPRPETEGLLDLALSRCPVGKALDVGTGCGAIALSLAQEGRYDGVVATDRSREALALAAENRDRLGLWVSLVRAEVVAAFPAEAFDLVVSNPPYLSSAEYLCLDPQVRAWEPPEALLGGEDGFAVLAPLVQDAKRVLRPGGWLIVEVDSTRAQLSAALAVGAGWSEVTIGDDLFQRARYLMARRSDST